MNVSLEGVYVLSVDFNLFSKTEKDSYIENEGTVVCFSNHGRVSEMVYQKEAKENERSPFLWVGKRNERLMIDFQKIKENICAFFVIQSKKGQTKSNFFVNKIERFIKKSSRNRGYLINFDDCSEATIKVTNPHEPYQKPIVDRRVNKFKSYSENLCFAMFYKEKDVWHYEKEEKFFNDKIDIGNEHMFKSLLLEIPYFCLNKSCSNFKVLDKMSEEDFSNCSRFDSKNERSAKVFYQIITKGTNLSIQDLLEQNSDPYFKVYKQNNHIFTSEIIKNSLNPEFQPFTLPDPSRTFVRLSFKDELRVVIWDWDSALKFKSDDYMGELKFKIDQLIEAKGEEVKFEIENKEDSSQNGKMGNFHLKLGSVIVTFEKSKEFLKNEEKIKKYYEKLIVF